MKILTIKMSKAIIGYVSLAFALATTCSCSTESELAACGDGFSPQDILAMKKLKESTEESNKSMHKAISVAVEECHNSCMSDRGGDKNASMAKAPEQSSDSETDQYAKEDSAL